MDNAVPGVETAVLVHIDFRDSEYREELDEFFLLAQSSGLQIGATITGSRDIPNAKYFVGSGKVEEIKQAVAALKSDIVVFNHALSPAQERNLEREFNCRVVDRTGLILDIFAQRAQSHEGKLQVELAQLQHLSTRLVRGWTHLERQKGGIGLRGPGESQLETDRRLIGKRIKTINARLEKVRRQRQQGRRLRRRTGTPLVSLVGYTNAGKSTLFNRLTGAGIYAADKLFATLDTTLRKVELAPQHAAVLSDTVGFIRHLPHDLVAAFHATLQEVREADLLLHVIDVNDEERHLRIEQVNAVIDEIDAAGVPQILVFNKIDCDGERVSRAEQYNGSTPKVWLSARTGEGMDRLIHIINDHLFPIHPQVINLNLPPQAGKLRANLYESGVVLNEQMDGDGNCAVRIRLEPARLERLCREHGLEVSALQ